jgi:HEAT repeat protein
VTEHIDDEATEEQARLACAAEWMLDLARAVRVAHLHEPQHPVTIETRGHLAETLSAHLERFGEWSFFLTASEMFLDVDAVMKPGKQSAGDDSAALGWLERLHVLLFRDGVRRITFLPGIPARDVDALVDALSDASCERGHTDDLVTALWQANPTHLQLETAPFEPRLHRPAGPDAPGEVEPGPEEEILGTFADPAAAYAELTLASTAAATVARRGLLEAWERERRTERLGFAGQLLGRLLAVADVPGTRSALARYAVTGVAESIAHTSWEEATRTLELVRHFDSDGSLTAQALNDAVTAAPPDADLGEALDQASEADQARCFAFALSLGHPGITLALAALAGAKRGPTREAACSALTRLCAEDPFALQDAAADPRAEVVLAVVSVLGKIGGSGLSPMLVRAAQHPDPSIQFEVVRALAAVPAPERAALLAGPLASADDTLCAEALRIASFETDRTIAGMILKLIEDPAFERRPEEMRHAFFVALAGSGGDTAVPTLEQMLANGGWFARASWQRSAAAEGLARIGTHAARKALERGLKHASEAVRSACREAEARRAA